MAADSLHSGRTTSSSRHDDYEAPIKPHSSHSSHRSGSSRRSRRTLSSEAEAARAQRERRIDRAVESAVSRRAKREAKLLGTSDVESVARRLREQREEAARWREMDHAKRRISKDRAKREARLAGAGESGRTTSTRSLSSHRTSRSSSRGQEPALSGWLDKRRDEKRRANSSSARRSASGPSTVRDSGSLVSALRGTSHGSSSRHHRSGSSRGRATPTSSRRRRSYRDDDDSATVATEFSSRSLKSSGSVGQKIRSLTLHRSGSNYDGDDAAVEKEDNTTSTKERHHSHRSSKQKKKSSSGHRRSKSKEIDNALDDRSVKSGRSSRSALSRKAKTSRSSKSKKKRADDASLKSGRSSRSLRSRSRGIKDDDASLQSGRSSRSLRSKVKGKKDDDESVKTSRSNRSRNDVKISRHARYGSGTRDRLDSKELFPSFFKDGEQSSSNNASSLEKEIVRLKLEIATARTEEEKERHRARQAADNNDQLRVAYQQQKNLAHDAKKDVDRLNKELERMRKLKAKVVPHIQESRIKAWTNRRRTSHGNRQNATRRSRNRSDASDLKRKSYGSGASISSWSIGESLYSVQSIFERGMVALEQETEAS